MRESSKAQRRMGSAMGEASYTSDELYMLHNHTGSIIGTYDLNGAQQEGEDYYPFGETAHNWNGNKLHRFGGKLRSFSSGFYMFGARQYAPWLAKFTSVDPLAAKSTDRNPYHYASNNPINRVDPSGMKDKPSGNGGGDKNGGKKSTSGPQNTQTDGTKGGVVVTYDNIETKNDFLNMLSDLTGNNYKVNDQNRLEKVGPKYSDDFIGPKPQTSETLSKTLDFAIKNKNPINVDLIGESSNPNTGVFYDSYETAKVGIDDFKMAPRELGAAIMGHVFMERAVTPGIGGYSNVNNRTKENFDASHETANKVELKILSEMTGLNLNSKDEPKRMSSGYDANQQPVMREVFDYGQLKYEYTYGVQIDKNRLKSNVFDVKSIRQIK